MLADAIRERAIGLLYTYRKETQSALSEGADVDVNVDVAGVLSWLNQRVRDRGLSLVTAKCYRRWLAAYFEDVNHPNANMMRNWTPPGSPEELLALDQSDAESLRSPLTVVSVETNSRYLSHLDNKTFAVLMEQLLSVAGNGSSRYQAGPLAALMFSATIMTGLRPMEWPTTRYLESFTDPETKLTLGPVLEVHTLKQSNRREDNPLREKRYLLLDRWPTSQLETLKAFVGEAHRAGDDFEKLYNKIRMTISRAWKRIDKDNSIKDIGDNASDVGDKAALGVSLYTARHIFAEEIRRGQANTRFELAAMLGHSLLTNQIYYGPRNAASERDYEFVLPRPWPGDADDIKQWDQKVNPLRHQYARGDLFGGQIEKEVQAAEDKDGVAGFFLR